MKLKQFLNFDEVITSLEENPRIPLLRGGFDTFIGAAQTKINGKLIKNTIHYRISDTNLKKVTFDLIQEIYAYHKIYGTFPSKVILNHTHMHELKSRLCNYSVACGIVSRFIK